MCCESALVVRRQLNVSTTRYPNTGRGLDHRGIHRIGDGDDIRRATRRCEAAFLGGGNVSDHEGLSLRAIDGATSRTLLVVEARTASSGKHSPQASKPGCRCPVVQQGSRLARPSPARAPGARAFRRVSRSTRRVGCRLPRASSWGSRWVTGGVAARPDAARTWSVAARPHLMVGPLRRGGEGAPRQPLARA
jgi:hypothetical protein